ncbi:MAG: EAL domain-containing protein, partial [Henriciella sp.]|nr:EAL domain-containing protein [Henriciella sp.]
RVIEHAIAAAAEMPSDTKIGINISPLQLHSLRLLPLIEAQLDATGLDPKRVELEITESVFLSDNAFILDRLRKLKKLGVRIAMDDFGTGFSSLSYLQRFPFDKLKLDQSFVRGIETSDQSCAIARATISMAHALGMTVTAEGVETDAQARFLREQGCDELQGFLFSRPQDQSALIPYLRSMELMHSARSIPGSKVVSIKR